MKIFVISLSESTDRQQFIKTQLDKNNTSFDFITAVNGKELTDSEKEKLYDDKKAKKIRRELTPGEIGCALSHKTIYDKMIKENIKRAVILEDDITIKTDFYDLLQYFEKIPLNKYIIKLERFNWENNNENNEVSGNFTQWHRKRVNKEYFIGQPINNPTLTWGYYIDLEAAKILYSLMPKVFLVADAWWYFRKYINLRMINKALLSNNDDIFNSLIGERNYIFSNYKKKYMFYKMKTLLKKTIKLFILLLK